MKTHKCGNHEAISKQIEEIRIGTYLQIEGSYFIMYCFGCGLTFKENRRRKPKGGLVR